MIDLNPIIKSLRKDISKIDEATSSQLEQYHELTKKAFEVRKKNIYGMVAGVSQIIMSTQILIIVTNIWSVTQHFL